MLLNAFFYLWIIQGLSLISMVCIGALCLFLFRLVRAPAECKQDWISDESVKRLYVLLYVGLNKVVQYIRSIIQIKGNMKAVAVMISLKRI